MSDLRAVLSVSQLAKMANVSRYQMARLLTKVGVPMHRVGHHRRVFLADVKSFMPVLWESIREYHRVVSP